jgi:hypothetical protein
MFQVRPPDVRRNMAPGGWKTARMMRRYAAVTDQTLRAAAEAVAASERALPVSAERGQDP